MIIMTVDLKKMTIQPMQKFEPIFANDGYRPNVGIIVCNDDGGVFWARRVNHDGWQFPQGGVARDENLLTAMYRELEEETGILESHVDLVAHTQTWLHYDLPGSLLRNQKRRYMRSKQRNQVFFRGQKQVWFLLHLREDDSVVNLKSGSEKPEFDDWKWVEADFAVENIVDFKRGVYQKALDELKPFLPNTA